MKKSLQLFLTITLLIVAQSANAQEETIKIAIIGNSITEGTFLTNPAVNSYPGQLAKLLPLNWEVGNFGVSGRTMLKNGDFPIWNEQKFTDALNFEPDIVVIMLGTNDSKPYNWDDHRDEFYGDYISMIDTFENLPSQPEIIVVYPPKAFTQAYDIRDSVISNEIIPVILQVSEERDLQVIDAYTPTSDKPDLFSDGIHPNLEGAHFLAEIFYTGLTGNIYQEIYDQNLVLDKLITSESNPSDPGQDANAVIDGDLITTWSFNGFPSALTIDLGEIQSIDQFELFFRNHQNIGLQYKIETSINGDNWNTVVDNTARTDTILAYSFDIIESTEAQFLKIMFTGTSTFYDDIVEINEFKALKNHGYFHAPLLSGQVDRIYYGTLKIVPTAETPSISLYTFNRSTNTSVLFKTYTDFSEPLIYQYRAPSPDPVLFMTSAYDEGIKVFSDTTKMKHVRPTTAAFLIEKNEPLFSVYPNPSTGVVNINLNQNINEAFNLKIVDVEGNLIQNINVSNSGNATNQFVWNGKDSIGNKAAPGIYFIQLKGKTISENRKVILK